MTHKFMVIVYVSQVQVINESCRVNLQIIYYYYLTFNQNLNKNLSFIYFVLHDIDVHKN
jgi:hypothetical protein